MPFIIAFRISVLLAFLAIPSILYADTFSGQVVGVIDGDTIDVLHNGKAERMQNRPLLAHG